MCFFSPVKLQKKIAANILLDHFKISFDPKINLIKEKLTLFQSIAFIH